MVLDIVIFWRTSVVNCIHCELHPLENRMLSVMKSAFSDVQIETPCYFGFHLLGLLLNSCIFNLSESLGLYTASCWVLLCDLI